MRATPVRPKPSAFYFAYGSEMSPEAMAVRLGHSPQGRPAVLRGFRLAFSSFSKDWGGGVADIVEEEGADVEGVLFPLSARDVLRLNVQEGLEEGDYRRRMVTVELEDGSPQEAMAYVVADKRPHVRPSQDYLDEMVSCATEQGLSEAYVHFLLQLYTDPDASPQLPRDDE